MRFSLASLFFIIAGFIFLALWGFFSFLHEQIFDALTPTAPTEAIGIFTLLGDAFGVLCAIFFITGIVLFFVLDSLADEAEMYWR